MLREENKSECPRGHGQDFRGALTPGPACAHHATVARLDLGREPRRRHPQGLVYSEETNSLGVKRSRSLWPLWAIDYLSQLPL